MSIRVCLAEDVPEGGARAFDTALGRVLVARIGRDYFVIADECTHAEASLSGGDLDIVECTVSCPLHGAVFDLRTGEALESPAEEPVEVFACRVEGGAVVIENPADGE